MFLGIGITMAILQGSWVRHIPEHRTKAVTELVFINYTKINIKNGI
jgi:hypothetical protein